MQHPMGLDPMTLPSILLFWKVEVSFELELIGAHKFLIKF